MARYFTSDWHAGEQQTPNTHSYLRPHPTEVMVTQWIDECHTKIKSEDILVFLGDIGITLDDLQVFTKLPDCRKILILGDKEYNNTQFTRKDFLQRNEELSIFTNVYRQALIHIGDRPYNLSHKPTECIEMSIRNGQPALCGHVHGIWRTQRMPNGQPIMNVGIDAWGGLVSEAFIVHQYDCVTKGYYDENCFPVDWQRAP